MFEKLWLMYQIFFTFYCFPPLQGGTKGGSNVMKITEYHFSNILSAIDLHKKLVAEIKSESAWYYEVSKNVPQKALADLRQAWDRCFKKTVPFRNYGQKR
ncbi:MAG: hypothetical protein AN490_21435 [Anabaena sp. AL09]|nr:MAG: hypothetical protein AN490_21435 [Anabaena sp. AL09]